MRQQEKENANQVSLWRKYVSRGRAAIGVAFLIPFVMVAILKILSLIPGQALVITDRIGTWFSFYGSYCGVFASIILGVVTLYLTEKLDLINKENNRNQERFSIIANMPNMRCDEAFLYSLEADGIPRDPLRFFRKRNKYIFFLHMTPAFPPYFDIRLSRIRLKLKHLVTYQEMVYDSELEEEDVRIMNNENVRITVNIPDTLSGAFDRLNALDTVTTDATNYERRLAEIFFDIQCRNTLVVSPSMDVLFRLYLLVENVGYNGNGDGKCLHVLTREFKEI